jgi:hypothetical protein
MYYATGLKFSIGLRILIIRVSDILHFIISWRYYQLALLSAGGTLSSINIPELIEKLFFLKLRS